MKRFLVKRPKDTVEVLILPIKGGYQCINLTKGHICPCKFSSVDNTLKDMDEKLNDGTVKSYQKIGDLEVNPC